MLASRRSHDSFLCASSPLILEFQSARVSAIHSGLHRAARYPFASKCEVIDLDSQKLVTAFTSNLSLFGCYIIAGNPFPAGTSVSLRIMRGVTSFTASGKVVFSKPKCGMGIAFTKIDPANETTLEKWIESLRTK